MRYEQLPYDITCKWFENGILRDEQLTAERYNETISNKKSISIPFDYNEFRTENGNIIDEAQSSKLLVTPEGSTRLDYIDAYVAISAGIQEGEIQANVGIFKHA